MSEKHCISFLLSFLCNFAKFDEFYLETKETAVSSGKCVSCIVHSACQFSVNESHN